MKCLFIINPSSGKKTIQKKLNKIIGELVLQQVIHEIDIFYTEKKNDAYYKCLQLNNHDYDFIVSVGGDGTLNEVISGFIKKELKIPLAILPGGTVNDFASYLKLPTSTQAFVNMIKSMKTITADIGKVNEHYFANVIAGGMFTDISFHVSKEEKAKLGPLAYYLNGLKELPSQLSTNLHLKITTDQEEFEEEARMFMIANTSQVGGFKGIAPHASIQDEKLDLVIIKKCSATDMIALFKDYKLNSHDKNPYIYYTQAHEITISCKENIIYDIDGEEGTTFPIHVSVIPKALHIIIPEKTRRKNEQQ